MSKRISRFVTIALCALVISVLWPQTNVAHASSAGCTLGYDETYTCLGIYGSGTHVDSFRVSYNKTYRTICAYQAKVTVTSPAGTTWTYWSSKHTGCSFNTAWFDFEVNRSYPSGSRACGFFYERGEYRGAKPCNTIKS